MPDSPAADLDATLDALKNGVTSLSPPAALRSIDSWKAALSETGKPELTAIADGLAKLKAELTSGRLNGAAIGHLLVQLGAQTSAAGQAANHEKVTRLGGLLGRAGQSLTGGGGPPADLGHA